MSLTDPFTISVIVIVAVSLLGLPMGHALIAGSILYLLLAQLDMGTAAEQMMNGMYTSYLLLAVPLFIFSAEIMNTGSMTDRLLKFCNALVGRFPGGLAHVNVVQSIIFSGMSGSAIADAAGSGKMMQTMMTKDGKYPPAFAAALTAASSVLGPIIPPSIPLVLYALLSNTSVGYLLIAGIVPGFIIAGVQMGLIAAIAKRRKFPVEEGVPLREIPRVTLEAFPALLMPIVLLGCLYTGITTPTEAAALAAAYALFASFVFYRGASWRGLYTSLLTSARTTASIGMLIAGALVFNYVITVENIPASITVFLAQFNLNPLTFMLMVNVLLLVLGCVLEGTTIILIVLPALVPTAQALGIDLVYFGIVAVVNIMLGLISPPYGLLLFVMQNITKIPLWDIIKETMPFLYVMIAALLLMTLWPESILWLPRVFGYQGGAGLP